MTFKAKVWGSRCLRSATAIVVFATAGVAQAAVGLYNTGVDDAGALLGLGQLDSHYTVATGGSTFAVNDAEGYAGYWLGPDAASRWVTPLLSNGMAGDSALTSYTVQTTFDMSGMSLVGATITGLITADNGITSILLNGEGVPFVLGGPTSGMYAGFNPFTLTQGFHAGLNTLSFGVLNGTGPTGLRVEMSNNFQATPVPEPESFAMLLAGAGLIGAIARRRKSKQQA